MAKSKIILLIIVVVIIIAAVVLTVILTGKKGLKGEKGAAPSEGKPIEEGTVIAESVYGFSAEIKGIKDKTLSLDASILLADTTKPPLTVSVKGTITNDTKIVMLEFPKELSADPTKPNYPKEIKMSFSDLRVGDKINVGTFTNVSENIKNNTEFPIKNIFIFEKH
jgi:hypothetical protein